MMFPVLFRCAWAAFSNGLSRSFEHLVLYFASRICKRRKLLFVEVNLLIGPRIADEVVLYPNELRVNVIDISVVVRPSDY